MSPSEQARAGEGWEGLMSVSEQARANFQEKAEAARVENVERALVALVEATHRVMPLRGFDKTSDAIAFFTIHSQAREIARSISEPLQTEARRVVKALRDRERDLDRTIPGLRGDR